MKDQGNDDRKYKLMSCSNSDDLEHIRRKWVEVT